MSTTYTDDHIFIFHSLSNSDAVREGNLLLYWELNGDPISDDYSVEDASASELWSIYLSRFEDPDSTSWHSTLGAPYIPIYWGVRMVQENGFGGEHAPYSFDGMTGENHNILSYYSTPHLRDGAGRDRAGDRVNWLRIPVMDKLWESFTEEPDQAYKGGFIQEHTGWKPHALQPTVDMRIFAAAGAKVPSTVDPLR